MYSMVLRTLIFLSAPVLGLSAIAQEKSGLFNSQQQITLSADNQMKWDAENNQYSASGNVLVEQGDTQLKAQKTVITYTPDQTIKTIIATGNVFIQSVQGGRLWGDTLEYNAGQTIAKLCGNAKIEQDGNVFLGQCINVNTSTGTSEIEGNSKKRITAVLMPAQK